MEVKKKKPKPSFQELCRLEGKMFLHCIAFKLSALWPVWKCKLAANTATSFLPKPAWKVPQAKTGEGISSFLSFYALQLIMCLMEHICEGKQINQFLQCSHKQCRSGILLPFKNETVFLQPVHLPFTCFFNLETETGHHIGILAPPLN